MRCNPIVKIRNYYNATETAVVLKWTHDIQISIFLFAFTETKELITDTGNLDQLPCIMKMRSFCVTTTYSDL